MPQLNIVPKSYETLMNLARPNGAQIESLPWVLYHEKTYTSGTTTELSFFDAVESNKALSNMEAAGNLPEPQFFEVHYVGCDILIDASASGASTEVGALDDVAKLTLSGKPRWVLNISNKIYGPFPLSFCHASGGPTGVGYGTLTAPQGIQVANNGIFDGGFHVNGSIVIPPKVGFGLTVTWNAAQTLNAGNSGIRMWMLGGLHRAVR